MNRLLCIFVLLASITTTVLTTQEVVVEYNNFVAKVEACEGTAVKIIWQGYHNIEEMTSEDCNSNRIGIVDSYKSTGSVQIYTNLFSAPGQTRYFKCGLHCTNGARFEVSCPYPEITCDALKSAYKQNMCCKNPNPGVNILGGVHRHSTYLVHDCASVKTAFEASCTCPS